MFTAILESVSEQVNSDGTYSFSIVYTDKASFKYQRSYTARVPNDAAIKQVANNELAILNAAYAEAGTKNLRPGDEIPIIGNSPAPQPTPERDAFMRLYAKKRDYDRAIAAGFVSPDDGEYLALVKQLQGLWLPEYIGLV